MITKTISLKDKHQEWIDDCSINLSRFVQKKIDEELGSDDELHEE